MRICGFATAAALLGLVIADLGAVKRTRLDIDWNEADFSKEGVFLAGEPAALLESFRGLEKNETLPHLQGRSAELFSRQQCEAGYGYCSSELIFLVITRILC